MRVSIIFSAVALVLAGCGANAGADDDRPRVVATTTQVGSIVRELGGDDISLTVLLPAGAEAHDYELTPEAAAAIEDADLILRSGAGLEAWLDDAIETIGGDARTADLGEGIELREPEGEAGDEDDHGDGEDTRDEDDHGHEDADPHYWLSGPNAIRMVENARAALVVAVPDAEAAIDGRASALRSRLEEADAEARRLIGEIPEANRGIVTNHDALGYFIDEYGLRFVASIFPSLDVSAEPSPAELAELVDVIRAEGIVAIFSESGVSPELAETIAAETGARVVDEPLYVDSLGGEGSGVETLDAMLIHNATVFRDALVGSGG